MKFEHKNNLFNHLRFSLPKADRMKFTSYKDLAVPLSVESFNDTISSLMINFFNEFQENSFMGQYLPYSTELIAELTEIKEQLLLGHFTTKQMAVMILFAREYMTEDMEDYDTDLWKVAEDKVSYSCCQNVIHVIIFQVMSVDNIINQINSSIERRTKLEKPFPHAALTIQDLQPKKFTPLKIQSRLKKIELVTLFWLLNEAKFLRFDTNKQLADFLEDNFQYLYGGKYVDVNEVEIEISRLQQHQIEHIQAKEFRDLRKELQEFDTKILSVLEDMKIKKPIKDR